MPAGTPSPLVIVSSLQLRSISKPAIDSLCLDTGSDSAENLDFDALTVSRNEVFDTGVVDMGFHSSATGSSFAWGAYDHNQTSNLAHFARLQDSCSATDVVVSFCSVFDFESDDDIDLDDPAAFEAGLSAP